jgi:hypothetical protein
MLYGHFAVSHQQLVPDRDLLATLSGRLAFSRSAMGLPVGPPALSPARPSSTR